MKKTNLYKANAIVNTNDDAFRKDKIIQGTHNGLKDYLNYVNNNIEIVQREGALGVPLRSEEHHIENNISKEKKTEVRSYIEFEKIKNEKTTTKIDDELFYRNAKIYSKKPTGDKKKDKLNEIQILDRNVEEKYLILKGNSINKVYLKANDYQLRKQKEAIQTLQNQPLGEHTPLQKLFDLSSKTEKYFEENITLLEQDLEWQILNKPNEYDGTDQQQNFVVKGLKTNDFALLEGPPGSGKTTAIIELIIQLIKQDKRVLLVSQTHVAVDNVIHRILTTYKAQCEGLVVPLRIATNEGLISKESVKPYLFKNFTKKTKNEITKNLKNHKQTKSVALLKASLRNREDFDDIILKSANIVGGTMMGILQHPDIKKGGIQEMFDVMIVDEASKVTFLDFLVPALYAKKWILVGDLNQLSPYTEDGFINENINDVLKDKEHKALKEELVKTFELKRKLSSDNKWDNESVKVLFTSNYNVQLDENIEIFKITDAFYPKNDALKLNAADVIFCNPRKKKYKNILKEYLFVKALFFEGKIEDITLSHKQNAHHKNQGKNKNIKVYNHEFTTDTNQEWKEMVGSRLSQMYQYRFEPQLNKNLKEELDFLVPHTHQKQIESIRRVAFPSILELIQIGVGEKQRKTKTGKHYKEEKLIYEGFKDFENVEYLKFQSLTFQHRMHDDIAKAPREYFYQNKNLETATSTKKRRDKLSFYRTNEDKIIWVANNDKTFRIGKKPININPTEVEQIKKELERFITQCKKETGEFEIAVLTFYTQQELELKRMLQKLTKQTNKNKFFSKENVKITLCTVDKFQGDEADLVLLSFTKFTKKAFYNIPNRLNVALTRARHKLVLFGNKNWLAQNAQLEGLRKFAKNNNERYIY